jgi:hypothetical protein
MVRYNRSGSAHRGYRLEDSDVPSAQLVTLVKSGPIEEIFPRGLNVTTLQNIKIIHYRYTSPLSPSPKKRKSRLAYLLYDFHHTSSDIHQFL